MPIHGSIEEAGLADVLQLLALGRKTGCLSVEDGATKGAIHLEFGRITYASVANRDRLGDMLLRAGRVTREALDAAMVEQERGRGRQLGRILVDSGCVSKVEVERLVRRQVEEAVYYLFTWKQGTFTFSSDHGLPHAALLVSLDAESLLLEGARRVDEWSQVEKKIPSFDVIFQRIAARKSGGGNENLSEDQQLILPLLDGTRTVAAVVDETGLAEFDVGKAIYGLLLAGYAKLVERRTVIRHLEYRELLAYVVHEAEFADPERRKQAARHIVDCAACSDRLRSIHVRKTSGQPAITETTLAALADAPPNGDAARTTVRAAVAPPPAPAIAPAPAAPPPPAAVAAAPPAPAAEPMEPDESALFLDAAAPTSPEVERRRTERRAGQDRRMRDRRAGLERRAGGERRATASARPGGLPDRRLGSRRETDRGGTFGVERRRGDYDRREPAPEAGMDVAARGARATIARQIAPGTRHSPITMGADAAHATTAVPDTPAGPAGPAAPNGDLVWLLSPDQSAELIRASRSQAPQPAARPPVTQPVAAAPLRAPLAARSVPEAAPVPVPAAPTGSERRAVAREAAPAPVAAPAPRREPGTVVIRVQHLVIAAGFATVALLGYVAGSRGHAPSSAQADHAPIQTAAATGTPTVQREPPAPARAETPSEPPRPAPATERPAPTVDRGEPPSPPPARASDAARRGAATPPVVTTRTVATTPPSTTGAATVPPQQAAATTSQPAPAPAQPAPQQSAPPLAAAQPNPSAPATPTPAASATPAPAPPPSARANAPDAELAAGGWETISRADAADLLGGTLGAVRGLGVESLTRSTAGSRARVRLAQVTPGGERIVLVETRAGNAVRTGPAIVTALRVMPPSEAYPFSSGSVSFGNILITAKSALSAEALRALLNQLGEIQ